MSDAPNQASGHCPECGIAVATGYARCPKCHAAMPDTPTHAGDAAATRVQGGTSVQSGGGNAWLYAAGGAVVLIALIVFVVSGGGDDEPKRPSPEAQIQAPPPGGPGPTMRREIVAPQPREPTVNPAPDPVVDHRVEAARTLLSRLEAARMWSTVEVEGAGLAIKSGYCDDPAVRQNIDAVTGELAAAGVKIVTCYERHGPKVFDLTLSGSGGDAP